MNNEYLIKTSIESRQSSTAETLADELDYNRHFGLRIISDRLVFVELSLG